MNHCENATKIREAILLRENVMNSRRFATFRLKSTSNPLRITVKTRRNLTVNIHSETLSRVEYIESQRNVVADSLSRLGYDQDSRMGESDVVCQQDGRQVNPTAAFVPQSLTSSVNVLKGN